MSAAKHTPGPLDYDPFQGDFGDPGDRTLSDLMVKARKQHECSHCCGPIAKGEQYRSMAGIADGDLMSWRWCAACCAAMVAELMSEDSDEPSYPFEARAAIAKATGSQS